MTDPGPSRYVAHLLAHAWTPAAITVLRSALAAACLRVARSGMDVALVEAIPGERGAGATCVFEAESLTAVRRALEIAQVATSRIDAGARPTRVRLDA